MSKNNSLFTEVQVETVAAGVAKQTAWVTKHGVSIAAVAAATSAFCIFQIHLSYCVLPNTAKLTTATAFLDTRL